MFQKPLNRDSTFKPFTVASGLEEGVTYDGMYFTVTVMKKSEVIPSAVMYTIKPASMGILHWSRR